MVWLFLIDFFKPIIQLRNALCSAASWHQHTLSAACTRHWNRFHGGYVLPCHRVHFRSVRNFATRLPSVCDDLRLNGSGNHHEQHVRVKARLELRRCHHLSTSAIRRHCKLSRSNLGTALRVPKIQTKIESGGSSDNVFHFGLWVRFPILLPQRRNRVHWAGAKNL